MKKYNVYGIGNAIVDIVTEVDFDFFEKNNIEKGIMTLVDEKRQQELMKVIDMNRSSMSGGGSAGNTVVAVNQFKSDSAEELAAIHAFCAAQGVRCATADVFGAGGAGATELATDEGEGQAEGVEVRVGRFDWHG